MKSAEVRLQNLGKQYLKVIAVNDVSLTIEPGSMVALLGPSGCGKTTCLRMIAGLVSPSSGEILVNGERITGVPVHKRNIGMLFQNYALFPHMTVAENIAFGLEMRGVAKSDIAARVRNALDLVRLGGFGDRFPAQLSGGQQQRVALARALVIEPAVLLLDEPLGALDKGLRESMQVELRALQRRLGVTTVMVTHDQDEALTMADQIVVMRDGRLEQVGAATDIYQKPTSQFVATFLGASNLFTGKVSRRGAGKASVATAGGLLLEVDDADAHDGDITVSVRPEAVVVQRRNDGDASAQEPNSAIAQVDQVVYRGFISHYYLRLQDGKEIIAYQQNQSRDGAAIFQQGEKVLARWGASSNHVIPKS
ncbi:ABC transporter ATP-binding protein [Terrarubrum flagellatum]|uniref:ABC transporter ATP-binding protein n=1 Tax=Terrirubrum flagellatum TaxID=2895980 RepID=UPI00314537E2